MVLLIFSDEKKKQEMISEDGVPMPISNCSGEWHYPKHCSSINLFKNLTEQKNFKNLRILSSMILNFCFSAKNLTSKRGSAAPQGCKIRKERKSLRLTNARVNRTSK